MTRRDFPTGLVAGVHTPMHADGSLHLERIEDIVEHLAREGAAGIYAVGSTGEGPSLTTRERRAVAKAYVEAAGERLPVIVRAAAAWRLAAIRGTCPRPTHRLPTGRDLADSGRGAPPGPTRPVRPASRP